MTLITSSLGRRSWIFLRIYLGMHSLCLYSCQTTHALWVCPRRTLSWWIFPIWFSLVLKTDGSVLYLHCKHFGVRLFYTLFVVVSMFSCNVCDNSGICYALLCIFPLGHVREGALPRLGSVHCGTPRPYVGGIHSRCGHCAVFWLCQLRKIETSPIERGRDVNIISRQHNGRHQCLMLTLAC